MRIVCDAFQATQSQEVHHSTRDIVHIHSGGGCVDAHHQFLHRGFHKEIGGLTEWPKQSFTEANQTTKNSLVAYQLLEHYPSPPPLPQRSMGLVRLAGPLEGSSLYPYLFSVSRRPKSRRHCLANIVSCSWRWTVTLIRCKKCTTCKKNHVEEQRNTHVQVHSYSVRIAPTQHGQWLSVGRQEKDGFSRERVNRLVLIPNKFSEVHIFRRPFYIDDVTGGR